MGVEFKDYYRILGVDRNAGDKAIKSAYRKLAHKYHPDVAKTKDAGERFKELNEAYEVLSDPEKRRRYDSLGPDWQRAAQTAPGAPGGGFRAEYQGDLGDLGDFSEFFRSVFGDLGARRGGGGGGFGAAAWPGPRRPRRGEDVQAGIEISLEEAFSGTRRAFALDLDEPCPTCQGSGSVSGEGAGGAGERGDLYLVVTVSPHPTFERKDDDIHLTLPVTAPEAALGTTLEVPTLRGKVAMKIPPATSSGRAFRLPGYGMPRLKGTGAGDQFVTVRIVMPTDLSAAEKELYEKLAALRRDNPRAYQG
ncbi:MAG: hypothetical protein DME15_13170 [Candidatus Rokuibacteriota bacterium]|nr:MAG: hypothetical protein DME15_13170 [Candidatus Rokubacteria bacterium]